MKPVFIDPRFRRIFERQIHRPLIASHLWGGQKLERLFLFYGQHGSGMEEAVQYLIDEYKIEGSKNIRVTKDAVEMKHTFTQLKENKEFIPLLIIRKGHLLKYHRELFLITHHLKKIESIGFILVIAEEVPNDEETQFWEQFKVRIPNALPTRDFYKALITWYIRDWENSGSPILRNEKNGGTSPHSSHFADLDLDELAISCAYTTQSTVKRFMRSLIGFIIDQYPESSPSFTMEFLKDHGFLYPFAGSSSVLSISPIDGHVVQMRFDPTGIVEAPSIEASGEMEKKKMKFTIETPPVPETPIEFKE